jgi:hypothetical protein
MQEREPRIETQDREQAAWRAITDFIRKKSAAGQLVTVEDIWNELPRTGISTEENNGLFEMEALVKATAVQNEELKEIFNGKGIAHYYSSQKMTETYARLLVRRGEDPLLMMAELVRENCERYPRPVPLRLFEEPAFGLSPGEISSCRERMAGQEEYRDIQQTTTSIGTVFLFSSHYLQPEYAAFLAEWFDVGLANSP